MNDVGGFESHPSSADQEKKAFVVPCDRSHRLRFINMSSQAKFYVWFSDNRSFKIMELDGISYQPQETRIFEIASGQRVSILVTGRTEGICREAYIIAASDPKVGHGTKRCPSSYT